MDRPVNFNTIDFTITDADLARNIKEWRCGRSQQSAAKALGMSLRTFTDIERGKGFAYPKILLAAIRGNAGHASEYARHDINIGIDLTLLDHERRRTSK